MIPYGVSFHAVVFFGLDLFCFLQIAFTHAVKVTTLSFCFLGEIVQASWRHKRHALLRRWSFGQSNNQPYTIIQQGKRNISRVFLLHQLTLYINYGSSIFSSNNLSNTKKHQSLCFHYWDYLTNFWRNKWRSIIDVVERLGYWVQMQSWFEEPNTLSFINDKNIGPTYQVCYILLFQKGFSKLPSFTKVKRKIKFATSKKILLIS